MTASRAIALGATALCVASAGAGERFVTLASTTSTQNSGLLDEVLPRFTASTGIGVRVIAVGTGQALRLGARCDADVVLVHHRPSEDAFVAQGHGVERRAVMHNDFVVVGPDADPAAIAGERNALAALRRVAASGAPFTSRGDDSGTHRVERALWEAAGIDVAAASGSWYRETGAGMGATLNTAVAMGAYALSDRATWLSFKNKGAHAIHAQGDPRLLNPYGIIRVSEARCPGVKADDAEALADWLTSPAGQEAIAGYRLEGQPLFFPDAAP